MIACFLFFKCFTTTRATIGGNYSSFLFGKFRWCSAHQINPHKGTQEGIMILQSRVWFITIMFSLSSNLHIYNINCVLILSPAQNLVFLSYQVKFEFLLHQTPLISLETTLQCLHKQWTLIAFIMLYAMAGRQAGMHKSSNSNKFSERTKMAPPVYGQFKKISTVAP